jgi:hypothetical protein
MSPTPLIELQRRLQAIAFAADAYLIAEAEEVDRAGEAASLFAMDEDGTLASALTLSKQRLNTAHDHLVELVRQCEFPCMCLTDENEWRPCPSNLCERPDHPAHNTDGGGV